MPEESQGSYRDDDGDADLRAQPIEVPVIYFLALMALCLTLVGCGAAALPFRVTADVAKVVPVAGKVVAVPFDTVGDTID